ncbi:hypothetical protein RCG19_07540 [Neobacillus sp. OS1-2]|uniref:hypothetical protein n=1 Tax=Neobacillus sp. OS1-2 TaxID=3070680 RepID=UPI0027E05878|nr:hypothetical protein [Neobacillus sp. OS1-2]WML41494.1 hypothetical protein RCG19_07540 [Neobacillus sp. OS1-2]
MIIKGIKEWEITFFEGMTGKNFLDFMAEMKCVKDHAKRNERLRFFDSTNLGIYRTVTSIEIR